MIRVDKGETFPITVALWDEETGANASGQIVYYDVRDINDNPLSPTLSGTLTESSTAFGVYYTSLSISTAGEYVCYAYCDDFFSSSEEIIVNPESLYDLNKRSIHYNISVEDVIRTNAIPTVSQTVRKVPMNYTDYIVNLVKADDVNNWDNPVASGIIYAHYRNITDSLPYKMAGEF